MNNRFGDGSFSERLHTSFNQLASAPATPADRFIVYDLEHDAPCRVETLILDSRLDDESKSMFETFDRILKNVFSEVITHRLGSDISVAKHSLDFSSLVTPLTKIVERELNNSFIQLIRRINGISMPLHYNKRKRGGPLMVEFTDSKNKQITVDLNPGKDEILNSQMIRNALELTIHYKDRIIRELKLNDNIMDDILKCLIPLRSHRNESVHTNIINESQFREIYTNYCRFIRIGGFSLLMDCKDTVRF